MDNEELTDKGWMIRNEIFKRTYVLYRSGVCYPYYAMLDDRGNYTFYNVIEGEGLLEEWRRGYQAEHYKQAYMEKAMADLGASSCEMELEIEELQEGRFLIAHRVSAW